jgi:uncharacterized protein
MVASRDRPRACRPISREAEVCARKGCMPQTNSARPGRIGIEYDMNADTTQIDLEALDRYLMSDRSPDDCMMLSDLDGFLTGVVISPELIPPSEWLPVIWGGEEPEFESMNQMQTIIGTIMAHYDEIATCFLTDPDEFVPIFLENPQGDQIVTDWAAGFLDAIELRRKAWEPLFHHRPASILLDPLLILGDIEAFANERVVSEREKQFYSSVPNVIPTCIKGIHDFWQDRRERQKAQPRRGRRARR